MNLNSQDNEIDRDALRGLRILLVDDEPQMQTVVNRYLESTFGRIEYTDDPATAYQLLADWSTRLRLKHLKIIILSHEQDGHKISEGFGLPITRYIAKEDLPRELLPFLTHLGSEIVPRSRSNRIGWHLLNDLTHHPGNIIPYYQLKVNPRRPLAAEALARWKNSEFAEAGSDIVPAGLFFPAIARLPEARQIDFIILEQVCSQLRIWQKKAFPFIRVSVNFSASHFDQPESIPRILDILRRFEISPRSLSIEITETDIMHNFDKASAMLRRLRELEIETAMDDFGVANSNLVNLVRLMNANTLDHVKLDGGLVDGILTDATTLIVTRAQIQMLRRLGMAMTVERIDSAAKAQKMHELDPTIYQQGFFINKPEPPEVLQERLQPAAVQALFERMGVA